MTKQRADLGFGAALHDLGSFDQKSDKKPRSKTLQADTRKAAQAAGFQSREAVQDLTEKTVRRRRTGRNAQFNIKAKPETIEEYCRIADGNDWGLGETLEVAVRLLKERYGIGQGS